MATLVCDPVVLRTILDTALIAGLDGSGTGDGAKPKYVKRGDENPRGALADNGWARLAGVKYDSRSRQQGDGHADQWNLAVGLAIFVPARTVIIDPCAPEVRVKNAMAVLLRRDLTDVARPGATTGIELLDVELDLPGPEFDADGGVTEGVAIAGVQWIGMATRWA